MRAGLREDAEKTYDSRWGEDIVWEADEEHGGHMAEIQISNYSDHEKREFVSGMTAQMLTKASPYEKALYEQFVEEGCAKGDLVCLEAKGYGCYGGNEVFPCDYGVSRDCMEELLALTDDASYANTLGYIYYYGRLDGKPDYEKAVRYFSLGAAQGIFESTYKLADMFERGQGLIQSPAACANLISMLYAKTKDILCHREYRGKFADVAFRMGHLMEEGIGFEPDLVSAYSAYLQAQMAIRLRMQTIDYVGDARVAARIRKAIERTYRQLRARDFFLEEIEMDGPVPLLTFLEDYGLIRVRLYREDGSLRVDFHGIERLSTGRMKEEESEIETVVPKQLVTIAEFSACILSSRLTIHMEDTRMIYQAEEEKPFEIDELLVDSKKEGHYLFLRAGTVMLDLEAGRLKIYKKDLADLG